MNDWLKLKIKHFIYKVQATKSNILCLVCTKQVPQFSLLWYIYTPAHDTTAVKGLTGSSWVHNPVAIFLF